MRETYVMRKGELVVKSVAGPRNDRSAAPNVITDSLPDLRHPITGKPMDSKSQFRAVTRAHGCVEVGNETQRDTRQFDLGNRKVDICNAITQLGG